MREIKKWKDYSRGSTIMSSTFLTTPHDGYFPSRGGSPTRGKRFFGSPISSPKNSPRNSPTPFERFDVERYDDSSEEKTSSDETELRVHRVEEEKRKPRRNSIIRFSDVKRKLSTTFHRRNSTVTSPTSSRKTMPPRRASTANMPMLQRQASVDEIAQSPKGLKRSVTIADNLPSSRSFQGHIQVQHPLLDRLRNNIMHMDPFATSSTPNIQSRSRANSTQSIKKFTVFLLGCQSVGKTALTVRFLTGRYIHEYTSSADEVYSRVVKYGDEQADVKLYNNDIENMEKKIELDQNSGIMILYSIVDTASFLKAKVLLEHLNKLKVTGQYPVMLIGTKRELSRLRKVRRQEAYDSANAFNCTHFEVSSAIDRKVKDCFHALFRQIEIRQLLHNDEGKEGLHTILNPPKLLRYGTYRHGTA